MAGALKVRTSTGPDVWETLGGGSFATAAEIVAGTNDTKAITPLGLASADAYVSVLAHGAKGDGVADDAPGIRAAAAIAQATNRGLFFPAGNYRVKTLGPVDQSVCPLITGIHISGVPGQSTIIIDPALTGWRTVFGSIPWQAYDMTGFVVENLIFDATGNTTDAVNATSQRYAISAYKGFDLRCRNCVFKNWDGRNIIQFISNVVTTADIVTNIYVHGCTFENIGGAYWHDHSAVYASGPDIHIYANSFKGVVTPASSAWTAIEAHGHRMHIHDNTFSNYNSPCLITPVSPAIPEAPAAQFDYHDNSVYNCGAGVTIRALTDMASVNVHDNTFALGIDQWPLAAAAPYPGTPIRAGLNVYGQATRIQRLRVHDNTCRWLPYTGTAAPMDCFIAWTRPNRLAGGPDTDVVVTNNDIFDCPSAGINVEHLNQIADWEVCDNRFTNVGKAKLGASLQAGMLIGFQAWVGTRPVGVQDLRFNRNKFIDDQAVHSLSAPLVSPAGAVRVDTGCSTNSTTTVVDAAAVVHDIGSLITGPGIPAGAYVTQITGSTDGYTGTGYTISAPATATASGLSLTLTRQPPMFLGVELFDNYVRMAEANAIVPFATLQAGQVVRASDRPVVVHKTSDQVSSDGVNLVDVTEMSFPVVAGATYQFEFFIMAITAIATTGLAIAVNGPAAPVYARYTYHSGVSGSATNQGGAPALNTALVGTAGSTVNALPTTVNGYLVNGPNAGTLTLRMRSEVDTSAVTLQRGSWGRLTRIA
jgi:hypothetical protein